MRHRTLILLMLLAAPAAAVQPPHRVQMAYEVTSGSLHLGEGRDVLEHDGKQYSIVSESKTVGLAAILYKMDIHRESRGLVTKDGLRPLHFEEENTRKPKRAVDFDWDAKLVRLTDGTKVETLALPENTFDHTSFAYSFAFRPAREEILPVTLTDGRKLSDYKYQVVGKEKIKTPIGELDTVHFQKVREADDKRGLEVWLAVGHNYLPVKIRLVDKDGRVWDSTVTAISYQ